jgi:hypothetical protein
VGRKRRTERREVMAWSTAAGPVGWISMGRFSFRCGGASIWGHRWGIGLGGGVGVDEDRLGYAGVAGIATALDPAC